MTPDLNISHSRTAWPLRNTCGQPLHRWLQQGCRDASLSGSAVRSALRLGLLGDQQVVVHLREDLDGEVPQGRPGAYGARSSSRSLAAIRSPPSGYPPKIGSRAHLANILLWCSLVAIAISHRHVRHRAAGPASSTRPDGAGSPELRKRQMRVG